MKPHYNLSELLNSSDLQTYLNLNNTLVQILDEHLAECVAFAKQAKILKSGELSAKDKKAWKNLKEKLLASLPIEVNAPPICPTIYINVTEYRIDLCCTLQQSGVAVGDEITLAGRKWTIPPSRNRELLSFEQAKTMLLQREEIEQQLQALKQRKVTINNFLGAPLNQINVDFRS